MIQMLMSLIWMMESSEKIIIAIDTVPMKQLVQPTIGMFDQTSLPTDNQRMIFVPSVMIDVRNHSTVIKGKYIGTFLSFD